VTTKPNLKLSRMGASQKVDDERMMKFPLNVDISFHAEFALYMLSVALDHLDKEVKSADKSTSITCSSSSRGVGGYSAASH